MTEDEMVNGITNSKNMHLGELRELGLVRVDRGGGVKSVDKKRRTQNPRKKQKNKKKKKKWKVKQNYPKRFRIKKKK